MYPTYITGFKHNGNGIDWLYEDAIEVLTEDQVKHHESKAGKHVDAVVR